MRTQHGRAVEGRRSWESTPLDEEPQTYRISSLTTGGPWNCPVEGCPGLATSRTAMRVKFIHRHIQDTVVILEEGKLPQPQFPRYEMLVPWRALNMRHPATAQCARGSKRKQRRLEEEELQESTEKVFRAYNEPLGNVTTFKYLGGMMTAGDDGWPTVAGNLQKSRKSWGRMPRILSREGADPKVSGQCFKTVV